MAADVYKKLSYEKMVAAMIEDLESKMPIDSSEPPFVLYKFKMNHGFGEKWPLDYIKFYDQKG